MAKATTKAEESSSKELEKKDQLPATLSFEEDAGLGLENVDRESQAIPFLAIMQKGSPQIDKDQDSFVKGAEVGDLMLTTTQQLFKDEDGVDLVFCGFRRVFLRWAPRDAGGGFKGEVSVEQVAKDRAEGLIREVEGKLFYNNNDLVRDTRIHYVLVLDGERAHPAVLSISSTQIKKSKMLITQINNYIAKGASGKTFNPPSFAHIFHAETVAEKNDQGTWRGWKFTRKGFVEDANLYAMAKEFSKSVAEETVRVDHAQNVEGSAGGSSQTDDENIPF